MTKLITSQLSLTSSGHWSRSVGSTDLEKRKDEWLEGLDTAKWKIVNKITFTVKTNKLSNCAKSFIYLNNTFFFCFWVTYFQNYNFFPFYSVETSSSPESPIACLNFKYFWWAAIESLLWPLTFSFWNKRIDMKLPVCKIHYVLLGSHCIQCMQYLGILIMLPIYFWLCTHNFFFLFFYSF